MSVIGGVNLGNLTNYHLIFTNCINGATLNGSAFGFVGDIAINGIKANELHNLGDVIPYAGTIYTNDTTLGEWQDIIDQNPAQASVSFNEVARLTGLENDLVNAIHQINALPVTPGFESVVSTSLDGLNTQNGINEVYVINVTSGFHFPTDINITGDAGDVYILRWDEDADPSNGYQGLVSPYNAAIVPHGGLIASNFIHVCGDVNATGSGGIIPPPPYPQGPRYNDGQGSLIIGGSDWPTSGCFTGYWLTTGSPYAYDPIIDLYIGPAGGMCEGKIVGGWYTVGTDFSMEFENAGVYISPNPATLQQATINLEKYVSVDNGVTWIDADTPPGPNLPDGITPMFRYVVTNNGDVTLTNISVSDDTYGLIGTLPELLPGASFEWIIVG